MEDEVFSPPEEFADLVVLEKNLFDIPLTEIHKVKVRETIMDGKTVYKA